MVGSPRNLDLRRNIASRMAGTILCLQASAFLAGCGNGETAAGEPGAASAPASVSQAAPRAESTQRYTLFEAGPVRPIAVLASGLVAVTNVPDDRVELFRPRGDGVVRCGSVAVGMRPVAVSAVGDQLWVVNHLSDSVSVLEVDDRRCTAQVVRTLQVGDEPRDVVSARGRAGATAYATRSSPPHTAARTCATPPAIPGIPSSRDPGWAGRTCSCTGQITWARSAASNPWRS